MSTPSLISNATPANHPPRPKGDALLGIPIGWRGLAELTDEAVRAVRDREPQVVFACANPHSLVTARDDGVFRDALRDADQVVADGVGVSLAGRWVGARIGPRITGTDYFLSLMGRLNDSGGGRVFFFGSSDKVLGLIAERMARDYPALTLCGALSPPYRAWSEEENRAMLAQIDAAQPDLLWVGMTAPKQEKWVFQNRHSLAVPVIGSIGAVFDFYAGTYPRAPAWMCRYGLEWLYRLISEPRRMWRRNFISTPLFLLRVGRQHGFGFASKPG
jgi:N-acetylglucosaminyldiphosphoundecaprenol N-acetyl-beta-D-mannosaminyltransferase